MADSLSWRGECGEDQQLEGSRLGPQGGNLLSTIGEGTLQSAMCLYRVVFCCVTKYLKQDTDNG
jgi:hypothetical protein